MLKKWRRLGILEINEKSEIVIGKHFEIKDLETVNEIQTNFF